MRHQIYIRLPESGSWYPVGRSEPIDIATTTAERLCREGVAAVAIREGVGYRESQAVCAAVYDAEEVL